METRSGARCLLTAACIFLLASCANLAPAHPSAPAASSSCPSDPCKMMAGMCGGRTCISTTNCGFRCADATAGANAAVISEKHFQINPVESLDVSLFGDPPPVEEVALPATPASPSAGSNSSGTASPARSGATVGPTAVTSTGHSGATRSPVDKLARTTAAGQGIAATTPAQGGDSAGRMPEVNDARGPTSASPRSSMTVASVTGSGGASLSSGMGSKATAGDSNSGSLVKVSSLVRQTLDGSSQTYTEIAPTAHVSTLVPPSSGVGPATEGSKSIPPGPKADPVPSSKPGGQDQPSKTTVSLSASVLATPSAPAGPNTPTAGAGRKELGLADITSRLIDIIDKIQEIYNRSSDSAAAAPEVRSPRRRDSGLMPAPDAPAQTVPGGDANNKSRNNGSSTGEQLTSVTAAPLNISTIAAESATNRTSPTEPSTEGTTEVHFPSLLDTFQTLTKGSASLNQPLTRIFSRVHHADEGFRIVFP